VLGRGDAAYFQGGSFAATLLRMPTIWDQAIFQCRFIVRNVRDYQVLYG
jgi:hypothetical protein